MAAAVGGIYETHLQWFARACIFSKFLGHDGHILQAYHFPAADDSKPAIVFLDGWTETSLKFGNVFKSLFDAGHSIYGFDLRGQGFSAPISYDCGPVSHMTDFGDYVKDLEHYIASMIGEGRGVILLGAFFRDHCRTPCGQEYAVQTDGFVRPRTSYCDDGLVGYVCV